MRGRHLPAHVQHHRAVPARVDAALLGGGKQRERSFKDAVRNGRTVYGSGRKLAQDAQLS